MSMSKDRVELPEMDALQPRREVRQRALNGLRVTGTPVILGNFLVCQPSGKQIYCLSVQYQRQLE
jgi:hypothetical protein